jgi:RNA-directed DNA polymerase
MVNAFNTTLKFNLIKSSTKKKLKLFQSDPILRIYLPKNKDQLKSLDILTLKNKYIQKLMLLLMEPYLEPCGDNNSFGFRPGREQNHAVTNLIPLLSNK